MSDFKVSASSADVFESLTSDLHGSFFVSSSAVDLLRFSLGRARSLAVFQLYSLGVSSSYDSVSFAEVRRFLVEEYGSAVCADNSGSVVLTSASVEVMVNRYLFSRGVVEPFVDSLSFPRFLSPRLWGLHNRDVTALEAVYLFLVVEECLASLDAFVSAVPGVVRSGCVYSGSVRQFFGSSGSVSSFSVRSGALVGRAPSVVSLVDDVVVWLRLLGGVEGVSSVASAPAVDVSLVSEFRSADFCRVDFYGFWSAVEGELGSLPSSAGSSVVVSGVSHAQERSLLFPVFGGFVSPGSFVSVDPLFRDVSVLDVCFGVGFGFVASLGSYSSLPDLFASVVSSWFDVSVAVSGVAESLVWFSVGEVFWLCDDVLPVFGVGVDVGAVARGLATVSAVGCSPPLSPPLPVSSSQPHAPVSPLAVFEPVVVSSVRASRWLAGASAGLSAFLNHLTPVSSHPAPVFPVSGFESALSRWSAVVDLDLSLEVAGSVSSAVLASLVSWVVSSACEGFVGFSFVSGVDVVAVLEVFGYGFSRS